MERVSSPVGFLSKPHPALNFLANARNPTVIGSRRFHFPPPVMSRESSDSHSEGEIVETGSEKATTSIESYKGTSVDRHFRPRASISRSPSPLGSPLPYRSRVHSRDGSRSPYRESRGFKRARDDDHYDRSRNDPRRFKVRYEESRPIESVRTHRSYRSHDQRNGRDQSYPYTEDRQVKGRSREKPQYHKLGRSPNNPKAHSNPFERQTSRGWRSSVREEGEGRDDESKDKLSNEQSVSDRGHALIAAAHSQLDTETNNIQTYPSIDSDTPQYASRAAKYVSPMPSLHVAYDSYFSMRPANGVKNDVQSASEVQLDEVALIEERRKRREAIKAKHRGQTTPIVVQDSTLDNRCMSTTPKPSVVGEPHVLGKQQTMQLRLLTDVGLAASPPRSPPNTSKEIPGQDSPTSFVVSGDTDLANSKATSDLLAQEDEPSAADYDPTMDMQEDKLRHDEHLRHDEISSSAYNEARQAHQDVLLPDAAAHKKSNEDAQDGLDMFAESDELDMFCEAPISLRKIENVSAKAVPVVQPKALDMGMLDDWDDSEGYYKVILGELLDGRYHIQSNLGKGMFSGVVRATDQKTKRLVAIKIIRNNETMKKAGLKEIEILQKLTGADPEDKKHIIRLERSFEHKGHLCMVFENLSINLREVLKKFGRDVGINLKAVRAYAQQMFLGLSLLRKCNILHADLKPDNVLVNESRNVLKVCDLGSASDASENEITQYLVSRFYRAPEIILGMPYDFAIDMWSVGCTLFELYTGKILFTGRSNNQMLRAIMECRGKISHKILRKAQFLDYHFDNLLSFRSIEKDRLTGKDSVRMMNFTKPTRDLKTRLMSNMKGMNDVEIKELNLFLDLLDRCLNLNPEKRCTPMDALKHPFILRPKT